MNRADEKKAFDAMLDEISDSDEEDNSRFTKPKIAESKSSNNYNFSGENRPNSNQQSQISNSANQQQRGNKMSKQDEDIENFGVQTAQSQLQDQLEQLNVTKRWLARPCSHSERTSMKCFVEREKGGFSMQTTYRCYLEGSDGQAPRFMMAAKKNVAKKTSYYLVSLDMNPAVDRGSDHVLGKVRGNAIGSKYLIGDHGLAPDKTVAPSMLRKVIIYNLISSLCIIFNHSFRILQEHGVISFEFDSGGPSRIEAWVPYVSPSGAVATWQPTEDAQSMETRVEQKDFDQLFYLQNKTPKWDEAHGGHVLNFQVWICTFKTLFDIN
jgi:hypothetical protein